MARILTTGVFGFIGSHLAVKLVQEGFEVYGLTRRVANRNLDALSNILNDIILVSGDVSDYVSVRNTIRSVNPDVTFHLAALSPVRDSFERPFEYQQANYIGTMNVAHSILELQDPQTHKLIAASTAEVYGMQANEPLSEELPLHPSSPYAVSKAAGDLYLQMMFHSFNLNGTVLRPTNSYGRKFDTSFIIEYLVTEMLKGKKIYIGAPDSVRDYMYVDDHVNAYVLAMKDIKAKGQVYNVGTTIGISNRELVRKIAKKIDFDEKNIVLGAYPPGYPYRPLVSDQSSIVLDSHKIRNDLRWMPKTSLDKGLDIVIEYFKQRIRKDRK